MTFYNLRLVVGWLPTPISNILRNSFVCYVIGGCIAASAHLMTVALSVELIQLTPENANIAGFIIGVIINYCYQRRITFRHTARKHTEQFPLFLGFALLGLIVNRFAYEHSMNEFQFNYLVAAAFAIFVVFIFNLIANTLVTFRHKC